MDTTGRPHLKYDIANDVRAPQIDEPAEPDSSMLQPEPTIEARPKKKIITRFRLAAAAAVAMIGVAVGGYVTIQMDKAATEAREAPIRAAGNKLLPLNVEIDRDNIKNCTDLNNVSVGIAQARIAAANGSSDQRFADTIYCRRNGGRVKLSQDLYRRQYILKITPVPAP